jgi:hypothetical protein
METSRKSQYLKYYFTLRGLSSMVLLSHTRHAEESTTAD